MAVASTTQYITIMALIKHAQSFKHLHHDIHHSKRPIIISKDACPYSYA